MNKIAGFFRTEYMRLVRFVRRLVDDAAERDAEDIVQDVMLNIFNRADFTIPIENLSAYIYQALRNKVVDVLRRRRDVSSLAELTSRAHEDTAIKVEKKERYDLLIRAIDSLSAEQRTVIIATEFEGRSFRELSDDWKIPIGTLLARKSRAMQKIKEKLTGLV